MITYYYVGNDWRDDQSLTEAMTWCNDGRNVTTDETRAAEMLADYVWLNPADAEHVAVRSYEAEE